jgi:SepF-like predicted cell division protein (DUF552 family)
METLQKAQELADKIFRITSALVLTGADEQEESDIAAYAKMVEDREPLIAELTELKQSIDEEMAASEEFAAVAQTISDITKLDEKHTDFMENMREAVQAALRKVKHGQKIHEGYQALPPETTSRRFDIKQ